MTEFLTMADSIVPANLLAGYDAYLVYVDGEWPTAGPVRQRFPSAVLLTMTVRGGKAIADGCDCEPGNLSPLGAAQWADYRLSAGAWRPVIYASIGTMGSVISELKALDISTDEVRLLSAHYGEGQHVCGPGTCAEGRELGVQMDGTQWTDAASGALHSLIDASALNPSFFEQDPTTWEDGLVATISEVKKGSSGQAVRNWQGILVAHGYDLGASGQFRDGVDGVFGDVTDERTRDFQKAKSLEVDGEVGQQTWTAALA